MAQNPQIPTQVQTQVQTERYDGIGSTTAAFFGGLAGAGAGVSIERLALHSAEKVAGDSSKTAGFFSKMGSAIEKGGFKGNLLRWSLMLVPAAIVGGILGAFARGGQNQFEAVKAERDEARGQVGQAAQVLQTLQTENQTLAQEKQALHTEVGEHRKRFTEGLKSVAEQGGHAHTAEAGKEAAAQAETTR